MEISNSNTQNNLDVPEMEPLKDSFLKRNKKIILTVSGVAIFLVIVGLLLLVIYSLIDDNTKLEKKITQQTGIQSPSQTVQGTSHPAAVPGSTLIAKNTSKEEYLKISADVDSSLIQKGQIEWNKKVEKIDDIGIFPASRKAEYYNKGKIKSGTLKDYDIILGSYTDYNSQFFRFLKNDEQIIILSRYSDLTESSAEVRKKLSKENEFSGKEKILLSNYIIIEELEIPTILNNGNSTFIHKERNLIFSDKVLKKVFTDATLGQIWTTDQEKVDNVTDAERSKDDVYGFRTNGFYAKAADGTAIIYSLVYDSDEILDIKWNNGEKYTKSINGEYSFSPRAGCGFLPFVSTVFFDIENELSPIGENGSGDIFYELKDRNNKLLTDYYASRYWEDGNKLPLEEFLNAYPIIFWKDQLGRLIKLESDKFRSAAECGKPVIYLYPENEQQISVKVTPRGGMSVSDPEYGDGWDVIAQPNGKIFFRGKEYPYLFWEGNGGSSELSSGGFIVDRNDLGSFFNERLSQAGLISNEIEDFKEFWIPEMLSEDKPYFLVSFKGNDFMNDLAPLEIEPKPDTVIRILMDYSSLDKKIEIEPQLLNPTEREGFTVVEWGGVLNK